MRNPIICPGAETHWNTFLFDTIKIQVLHCRFEESDFTGTHDTVNKQAVQISWSDRVILLMRSGVFQILSQDFHEDIRERMFLKITNILSEKIRKFTWTDQVIFLNKPEEFCWTDHGNSWTSGSLPEHSTVAIWPEIVQVEHLKFQACYLNFFNCVNLRFILFSTLFSSSSSHPSRASTSPFTCLPPLPFSLFHSFGSIGFYTNYRSIPNHLKPLSCSVNQFIFLSLHPLDALYSSTPSFSSASTSSSSSSSF